MITAALAGTAADTDNAVAVNKKANFVIDLLLKARLLGSNQATGRQSRMFRYELGKS
ncbi:hypothetical protein G7A66_08305 [Altererythrobacter sp. SALINAS58]|nr:hypothetical protein [Alteripontixanthobacter muriae]